MTRYWIKIIVGALLIFIVGMAAWMGIRRGVSTVHTVLETADPITIPIKVVHFRVDGSSLGRIERIRFLRTAPKSIESVEVTVRVDSAAAGEGLRACAMRIDDLERLDEQSTFVCVRGDSVSAAGAFEPFGQVLVEGTDIVLPLLLPADAVRDLRNHGLTDADSMAPPAPPEVPPLPSPKVTVSVP